MQATPAQLTTQQQAHGAFKSVASRARLNNLNSTSFNHGIRPPLVKNETRSNWKSPLDKFAHVGPQERRKIMEKMLGSSSALLGNTGDIQHIEDDKQWEHIDNFQRVGAGGSCGVFIFDTVSGPVVFKSGPSIGQEVFCSELATFGNICAPMTKLVQHNTHEFDMIKKALLKATEGDVGDTMAIEKEFTRPFFSVMEFVEGLSLFDLGDKAASLLGGDKGPHRLEEIGKILALDIVTNNWDRLPLIWDNEGNAANIIIQELGAGRVVAIDQGLAPINKDVAHVNYEKYINRIKTLFTAITEKPNQECPEMKHIREYLTEITGFDIGEQGSVHVQIGIMKGAVRFAELHVRQLEEIKKRVAALVTKDYQNVWGTMMSRVDVDFMVGILDVLRTYVPKMKEILTQQPSSQ